VPLHGNSPFQYALAPYTADPLMLRIYTSLEKGSITRLSHRENSAGHLQ